MLPNKSLMLDDESSSGQQQFYPCLGSRRIRNDSRSQIFNFLLKVQLTNNVFTLISIPENTILESEGKLYIDNVHLELNISNAASSSPVDIDEKCKENVKVSQDDLHETCSECFQKIEDISLRNSTLAVSPDRIRRRRLSRQFSAQKYNLKLC